MPPAMLAFVIGGNGGHGILRTDRPPHRRRRRMARATRRAVLRHHAALAACKRPTHPSARIDCRVTAAAATIVITTTTTSPTHG